MKISAAQIQTHLSKGLKTIYCISGDEPLQMMEAVDAIRAHARQQGFTQREVFDVERGFDWNSLLASSNTLSLFAEQRILELRLPSGSPGKDGGEALREYAARPAEDAVLIIQAGKIDKRSKNSAWYKALDAAGVMIEIWPIKATEIIPWIRTRLANKGLQADNDAVRLIAQRVEGNLLAAAQEVEKLLLLQGEGTLSLEQAQQAVANHARYSVYELIDSALRGEMAVPRCLRMLRGLKAEGTHAVQVLSPIVTELRSLNRMCEQAEQGVLHGQIMSSVWANRKSLVAQALQRLSSQQCQRLLAQAAQVDAINKGVARGDAWLALEQLLIEWCSGRVLLSAPYTA